MEDQASTPASTSRNEAREEEWNSVLQVQQKLKESFRTKLKNILEDIVGKNTVQYRKIQHLIQPLHYILPESKPMTEHEVWRIEQASLNQSHHQYKTVKTSDIFKPLSKTNKPPKTVLTTGISGIGKTVCVQKFIFDWAEGNANQDVHFMFLLPFWELDVLQDGEHDLHELLCKFYPELEGLNQKAYKECKVLFILDGLDENREFFKSKKILNVAKKPKKSSLGELISDLISGKLLPSAHIWMTSRPAEVKLLSTQPFDRVTELQGFSALQIENYIEKKINYHYNEIHAHIKPSRNLYVMCHVPFFCHITTAVLEKMINSRRRELPKTLTEIYTCFVLNKSEDTESNPVTLSEPDEQIVVALGEFAFKHLGDNTVITEEMLSRYGIVISEEAEHSQVLMFILREEKPMTPADGLKRYRFLHSGVQEFLAALYVLNSYTTYGITKFQPVLNREPPRKKSSAAHQSSEEFGVTPQQQSTLHDMLRVALDNALRSHDGHLDLFLRFLLGLSLNYNENSLSQLIGDSEHSEENIQKTVRYIKYIIKSKEKSFTHPQCINLLHCLAELQDSSVENEMQMLLSSFNQANDQLSIAQCSVLAYLIQVSGTHEELNVGKLQSDPGSVRLASVLKYFKKVSLECWTEPRFLDGLILALESPDSQLRELDLSYGDIMYSSSNTTTREPIETCGTRILQTIVFGPHVQLHCLKLRDCGLCDDSCDLLALALQSTNSVLKELDLSYNNLTDCGVQNIFQKLGSRYCVLEILRLSGCGITADSCRALGLGLSRSRLKELQLGPSTTGNYGLRVRSAAVKTNSTLHLQGTDSSALKELDLSNNDLEDSGVKLLCTGLTSPHCKLESLSLSGCMISEEGCSSLASALKSETTHLTELDLCYNHPGESKKLLSDLQEDPQYKLRNLNLCYGGEQRMKQGIRKYTCNLGDFYMDRQRDFDQWERFLEGFSGLSQSRFYWQVEWTGRVCIGMKYKEAQYSWYLHCSRDHYSPGSQLMLAEYNKNPKQLGVYLDWPAGMLSFYEVTSDKMTCVHKFHHRFWKPLFPYLTLNNEGSIKKVL